MIPPPPPSAHLRKYVDRIAERIAALPRATSISDEEARQFMHGLILVLIEAAEGSAGEARTALVDSMRGFVESGRPLSEGIRGISRGLVLFAAVAAADLPEAERADGALWLANEIGEFLKQIMDACMEPT